MIPVSSWGRLEHPLHEIRRLSDKVRVKDGEPLSFLSGLAYGNGRSYGDVCLNPGGVLWETVCLNRFIEFDLNSGRLKCEAGVTLGEIQDLFIPRGWALPVTPGTQFVTVGGAIANDVHGKNHHVRGSFGDNLLGLTLKRTSGEIIQCGPDSCSDWFAATIGGLGLTGLILEAEIQLVPVLGPWLETETIAFECLQDFFQLADASEADWEYTVSWIDCAYRRGARGLFMRANPVRAEEKVTSHRRKLSMPFVPPVSLVNQLSLKAFNLAYFHNGKRQSGRQISHYESFFYPLDNVLEWNKMYGPKGFYQYQSVIPRAVGEEAISQMLDEIVKSGLGSFLAVLKTFGHRHPVGMLSFPTPGVTLALDFPNTGDRVHHLFERLDEIVLHSGGRIYPAKDARMPRALFEAGYPRLSEFLKFRDPGISSGLSRRLMGS